MDADEVAMTVGVVAATGVLLALVIPPLAIRGTGVQLYYEWWTLGPVFVAVLAFLSALGGLLRGTGRITPQLFAGLLLGLTPTMLLVAGMWAVFVPPSVVMGLPTIQAMLYHRWLVVGLAAVAFVAAVWYARAVLFRSGAAPA